MGNPHLNHCCAINMWIEKYGHRFVGDHQQKRIYQSNAMNGSDVARITRQTDQWFCIFPQRKRHQKIVCKVETIIIFCLTFFCCCLWIGCNLLGSWTKNSKAVEASTMHKTAAKIALEIKIEICKYNAYFPMGFPTHIAILVFLSSDHDSFTWHIFCSTRTSYPMPVFEVKFFM